MYRLFDLVHDGGGDVARAGRQRHVEFHRQHRRLADYDQLDFGDRSWRHLGHCHTDTALLEWMAPDADFILAHWGKLHRFDWRPVGPRRRTRDDLLRFFSPEFAEK